MTRKPRTVTVLGRRWTLVYGREPFHDGHCDPPTAPRKVIRLPKRLLKNPKRRLEVLIHEVMHAADWSKEDAWVEQFACDLAKILTSEGLSWAAEA